MKMNSQHTPTLCFLGHILRKIRHAALLLLFAVALASPHVTHAQSLVVATAYDMVPFSFIQRDSIAGYDIDLWKAIAKEAGLSFQFLPQDFSAIIPALKRGTAHVGIASITRPQTIPKDLEFSTPYYESGLRLLVRTGEATIAGPDDLKGRTIACKLGTTSVTYAYRNLPATMVSLFREIEDAFQALLFQQVDAVLFDAPIMEHYALQEGKGRVKVVGPLLNPQHYAIAMRKDLGLKPTIDAALETLQKNGTLRRIHTTWFGEKPTAP
jgi:glutamine transport system substrate-binding protein